MLLHTSALPWDCRSKSMEDPGCGWGVNRGAAIKLLAGFLRLDALSGRGCRWAKEEGTVTQFANTISAGCITCTWHASAPSALLVLKSSYHPIATQILRNKVHAEPLTSGSLR